MQPAPGKEGPLPGVCRYQELAGWSQAASRDCLERVPWYRSLTQSIEVLLPPPPLAAGLLSLGRGPWHNHLRRWPRLSSAHYPRYQASCTLTLGGFKSLGPLNGANWVSGKEKGRDGVPSSLFISSNRMKSLPCGIIRDLWALG